MEAITTDVELTPSSAEPSVADSSSAVTEPSVESQASVTGTEAAPSTEVETQGEVDPLEGLPSLEELEAQVANKVPYAQALAQLRPAYEGLKTQLDSYKSLDSWKPIVETIGDPSLAQTAYEMVSAIHTSDPTNPNGFTSRPFLERLEQESPGSVDQIFADTLSFQVPDEQGRPSTVVRELVKSWGLNPDRLEDYRNIDTLRASGVVTGDDLTKVPENYHDAFRSLSQAVREDLLSLKETNPVAFDEYLRNANEALEARTWREKDEQAKKAVAETQQAQWEQQVTAAIDTDLSTEIQSIHDSVHQNLLSRVTFSSDATQNALEGNKILSVLGNLFNPYSAYRDQAVNMLKSAGVDVKEFYDAAEALETKRAEAIRAQAQNRLWDAKQASTAANLARQQILAKAHDYAFRLAKATTERAQAQAAQVSGQLEAATARFVPNGNGQAQQTGANPFLANPYPINSPEFKSYERKVERSLQGQGI